MEKGFMNEIKISIVLVNYNGGEFQLKCIESIKNQSYDNIEIIIVDNHSEDGSLELLEKRYKEIDIIRLKKNIGFSGANNIGIRKALNNNSQFVLLLNNDTVIDRCMVEELLKYADEDTVTAPKMYYFKRKSTINYAGGKVDWDNVESVNFGVRKLDTKQYSKVKQVEYVPFAGVLIPKKILKTVGRMDEKYFLYYEDTDYCVRIKEKGFRIIYVPDAKLWHCVNYSTRKSKGIQTYYMSRNQLYFAKKHYKYTTLKTWLNLTGRFFKAFIEEEKYKYVIQGYRDFILGRMGKQI